MKIKLLILLGALAILPFSGCKNTSPQAVAYKTEGVIIHTVDSSMKAWSDYVRQGKATSEEVALVEKYYRQYALAQWIAKDALELSIAVKTDDVKMKYTLAVQGVQDAANVLIQFIAGKIHKV